RKINMIQKVIINNYSIDVENLREEIIIGKTMNEKLRKICLDFQVSHKDYNDITTLLYTNYFIVKVLANNINFSSTIRSYSTSITNLYEENAVGDFKLELIERV